MNIYGVIMAGGGGTRFWPMSRQNCPKQLLNLSGKGLMINETIDRMEQLIPAEQLFIVTAASQLDQMLQATKGRIAANHILAEPAARNTAACIGYAACEIIKKYGDGVMCVVPSDAYIEDAAEYITVLKKAINVAIQTDDLVTIGITPTFASTGYGYIQKGNKLTDNAFQVSAFREKPDEKTAKEYFESGKYLWNSGMFIWRASTILAYFEQLLPDIYSALMQIKEYIGTSSEQHILQKVYPTIRKISIDYGIMEHCSRIAVVPGDFGWSDVGSWDALGCIHKPDENGNIIVGDAIAIDSSGSVSFSNGRTIAMLGVHDMIIVETPEAVLVCPKNRAQDIRQIVDRLEREKKDYLL